MRIPMRPEETQLYDRIDEYITEFYQKYENERRGLGFVMTVYRRRLTSSFYAVRCSLERRLQYLQGLIRLEDTFENDDVEQDELDLLDKYLTVGDPDAGVISPITLADLERLLADSEATGHLFETRPDIPAAYLLRWQGQTLPVTFSPDCFDEHPDTVRFLSYGNPLLAELLESVPAPTADDLINGLIRLTTDDHQLDLRAWYRPQGSGVEPVASRPAAPGAGGGNSTARH